MTERAGGGVEHILELLDGRHDRVTVVRAEQIAKPPRAGRPLRFDHGGPLEGGRDLPVELRAVRDDDDGGVAEGGGAPQLDREPEHRQRLAGALRVPHHPSPLLRSAPLEDARYGLADGAILLVARQLLHQPPALVLEDDVVAQDVDQDRGIEQAGDEPRLPLGRGAEAALELALGEGLDRLPAGVGVLGRAQGAEGGIGAAVGDAQQVRVEEFGGAGALPLRPGLLVATQLLDRLVLPDLQQRRRLRLHDDEGDAVHEEHEVGLDDALVVLAGAAGAALAAAAYPELRGDDVLVQPTPGSGGRSRRSGR